MVPCSSKAGGPHPHWLWWEFALAMPLHGALLLPYSISNALRGRPGLLLAFSTGGDSYGSSQPLSPIWTRCSTEINAAGILPDTGVQPDLLHWSSHDDAGCVNWRGKHSRRMKKVGRKGLLRKVEGTFPWRSVRGSTRGLEKGEEGPLQGH